MRLDFVATRLQAQVMSERGLLESAYERLADSTMYWGMVDLVSSSNYRLAHGPREGYIRGETFLALVKQVVTPCNDVRQIKELGDAVLLASTSLRSLLETLILVDQVATQMALIAGNERDPFQVRSAVNFGVAKRLMRPQEDFLGHPLDALSRVMQVRSDTSRLLITDGAYGSAPEVLEEYAPFLEVSAPIQLPAAVSRDMLATIYYREVVIHRNALSGFERYFSAWKSPSTPG